MLPSGPIAKHVVLAGAGNAHIQFVKRFGMRPVPGVAVTLLSESSVIPYSAMVPGHLAGEFCWDEITIDLVRLCRWAGVRFLPQRIVRIDPSARRVHFEARPTLSFDVLSVGLGSLSACPPEIAAWEYSTQLRPLQTLVRKIEQWESSLQQQNRKFHLVVVGGGASGCELALAIQWRLRTHSDFHITLLQGNDRLLPQFPPGVERIFRAEMQSRGIAIRVASQVVTGEAGMLRLENGERLPCDAVCWATHAAAHSLIRESGLAVDRGGFMVVKETLQSISNAAVFGTGDCVAFQAYPTLAKNGVHAVRQGSVLFENVMSYLQEQSLTPFRPQRLCLALLNMADGQATLSYGPFVWKGHAARRLKHRIDRAWIEKFTELTPMRAPGTEDPESPAMRCGGCGSKVSGDVLSSVLSRIDCPDDPRILLGCQSGEDAAVYRMQPSLYRGDPGMEPGATSGSPRRESESASTDARSLVEVQTVDYFKSFVDDPYLFGRITALHAVSDLYAMNARPFAALAIATLPFARSAIQEQMLFELLSGAMHTFRQAGVALTGGHTTEGEELALGFTVTGHGEEGRLFQKGRLQPGDRLVLTKPLGTGALLAAWMRGMCRADWYDQLTQAMLESNAAAARVFDQVGVTACTDITGFGLAGHLFEMLDKSGTSATLSAADIRRLPGFDEVVSQGVVSTLHADNAKRGSRIQGGSNGTEWLYDPQTSGGLLAGVHPDAVDETMRRLSDAGVRTASVVGEVIPLEPGSNPIIQVQFVRESPFVPRKARPESELADR